MPGGLGPAYGQTDVMHDRSYLIANLAHRNRAVREQAAVALANLNRQEEAQQRDVVLAQRDAAIQQRQINHEATQRRIMAHQNAMEMDKQLKIDRDTEIDEQGHGLLLSMMKLDAAKRRGEITKDQYDQGLLDAATQYPLGLRHPEAQKHLQFVTQEADRQNAFLARRLTGPPPEKIVQRYAHVQGAIDQRTSEQQADIARQEKLNIDAKKEKVPYNPTYDPAAATISGSLKGYQTEKAQLEQAYPQLNPNTQTQQTGQIQTIATPTPEPSPTPDTRPVPGFNIPILQNAPAPSATPISTPAPTETPTTTTVAATPTHLGTYNPETGEFE